MAGILLGFFRRDSSSGQSVSLVPPAGLAEHFYELQLRLTQEEFFDRVIAFDPLKTILSTLRRGCRNTCFLCRQCPILPGKKSSYSPCRVLTKDRLKIMASMLLSDQLTITSLVHQFCLRLSPLGAGVFLWRGKSFYCVNSDDLLI